MNNIRSATEKSYIYKKRLKLINCLFWIFTCLALIFGFVFALTIPVKISKVFAGGVIIFVGLLFYYLIIKYGKELGGYIDGIRAEERVYAELEFNLPSTYHCIRNLQMNRHDIDVVAWGPTGIFAIEVKSFDGKVDSDGSKLIGSHSFHNDPVKQAKMEAAEVFDLLKNRGVEVQWVNAILALPGHVTIEEFKIPHLTVCQSHRIAKTILDNPHRLTTDQIKQITEVLKQYVNDPKLV